MMRNCSQYSKCHPEPIHKHVRSQYHWRPLHRNRILLLKQLVTMNKRKLYMYCTRIGTINKKYSKGCSLKRKIVSIRMRLEREKKDTTVILPFWKYLLYLFRNLNLQVWDIRIEQSCQLAPETRDVPCENVETVMANAVRITKKWDLRLVNE